MPPLKSLSEFHVQRWREPFWAGSSQRGKVCSTPSVGARRCPCVQQSCLRQVEVSGCRGITPVLQGCQGLLVLLRKVIMNEIFLLFLPRMLSRKLPIRLTQKGSSLCMSLLPVGISSSSSHTLWWPHFPLLWPLTNFWNEWLETKVIPALTMRSQDSHCEFSSRWISGRAWQLAMWSGRTLGWESKGIANWVPLWTVFSSTLDKWED